MKKNPINHTKIKTLLEKPGSKLLLQRADRLGDMILCLPAIESIRNAFPKIEITMIGSSKNCQLLKSYPLIDNFVQFDIDSALPKDKKGFIEKIKKEKYDCYISFWANSFFEKLAKKASIKFSIGAKTSPLSTYYYSHPIKVAWDDIFFHEIDFNLSLLFPLNIPIKRVCKLYPTSSLPSAMPSKTCVIFCSSGGSNFSLSEDMIINLIHLILENTSYNVTLTYGFIEEDSKLLKLKMPRLNNIVTSLNFDNLLEVINEADIYIGPDTGPTHMASFVNTPSIVSFRNINSLPIRWGPQSTQFNIVRYDYKKITPTREKKEVEIIFDNIHALSNLKKFNSFEKRLLHLNNSLRICFELNDLIDFKNKKTIISQFKQDNWKVFIHLKRRNPIKNFLILFKKYKFKNINVFITDKKNWYHYIFQLIFNSHLKPKPVFLNSIDFESYCYTKLKMLVKRFG